MLRPQIDLLIKGINETINKKSFGTEIISVYTYKYEYTHIYCNGIILHIILTFLQVLFMISRKPYYSLFILIFVSTWNLLRPLPRNVVY